MTRSLSDQRDEIGFALKVLPLLVLGAFALMFFFGNWPEPKPLDSAAYGCFRSANAPAIELGAAGIRVNGLQPLPFRLERMKNGINLVTDVALVPVRTESGFEFHVDSRAGRFHQFYRVKNGRAYWVMQPQELDYFDMFTSDGIKLTYRRTSKDACAAI